MYVCIYIYIYIYIYTCVYIYIYIGGAGRCEAGTSPQPSLPCPKSPPLKEGGGYFGLFLHAQKGNIYLTELA